MIIFLLAHRLARQSVIPAKAESSLDFMNPSTIAVNLDACAGMTNFYFA